MQDLWTGLGIGAAFFLVFAGVALCEYVFNKTKNN